MEHTRQNRPTPLPPRLARAALAAATTTVLAGCAGTVAPPGPTPTGTPTKPRTADTSTVPRTGDGNTPPSPHTYGVPSARDVLAESSWGNLFASIGNEAVEFGRRVQTELPVAAYAQWSGVGGGEPMELTDPNQIRALFNALAGARLGEEAQQVTTDDYTSFWFTFANGDRFSVSLDSLALPLYQDGRYSAWRIDAGEDFYLFAELARQKTLASY